MSNELHLQNAVDNIEEIIPTFDENEDTWENDVLYGSIESNDEEVEIIPDVIEVPQITYSELKKDWYAFKTKIQHKNCSQLMQLIEKIDEALYKDCNVKRQQSVIGDFFHVTEPSPSKKKPKLVIDIDDDDFEGADSENRT